MKRNIAVRRFTILLCGILSPCVLFAHGGGVDRTGCHKERATGTRHCHSAAGQPTTNVERSRPGPSTAPLPLFSSSTTIADEQVRIVQKMLIELDFPIGEPDGLLGAKTIEAIESVERKSSLPVTGMVTLALIDALISDLKGYSKR